MFDFISEVLAEFIFSPPKCILKKAKGNTIVELILRVLWSVFLLVVVFCLITGIVYLIDAKKEHKEVEELEEQVVLMKEVNHFDSSSYEGLPLPEDVHEGQILRKKELAQGEYALVYKNSTNIFLAIPDDAPQHPLKAGILKKGMDRWDWFLEIQDSTEERNPPKNNPLDLLTENGKLVLAVMDANGAGSGEGFAKIYRQQRNGEWKKELCGYYANTMTFLGGYHSKDLQSYALDAPECINVSIESR